MPADVNLGWAVVPRRYAMNPPDFEAVDTIDSRSADAVTLAFKVPFGGTIDTFYRRTVGAMKTAIEIPVPVSLPVDPCRAVGAMAFSIAKPFLAAVR